MERKLRILSITFYGSWTLPLIKQLKDKVDLEVIVPTSEPNKDQFINDVLFHYLYLKNQVYCAMSYDIAKKYLNIINEFKPDLIHIHGTEKNLAQIHKYCPHIPIVVSIQGILTGYIPYATNGLNTKDVLPYRSLKNILGYGGLFAMYRRFIKGSKIYERNILESSPNFFCRTDWDRAWVNKMNPKAKIYQGEELLRDPFYKHAGEWSVSQCKRHQIFMPAGFNPIKGLHIAVDVINQLKNTYSDVVLHVPGIEKKMLTKNWVWQHLLGEEYIRYVLHKIHKLGLEENIKFYDKLDAEQMSQEMLSANVFLSPTSIDNSPNSIGEAMMLGLPVVSTPVGGIPSFIHHDKNGLLATPDKLADNIDVIFRNDERATQIGKAAYATALTRHDRHLTAIQYIKAYKEIISNNK